MQIKFFIYASQATADLQTSRFESLHAFVGHADRSDELGPNLIYLNI